MYLKADLHLHKAGPDNPNNKVPRCFTEEELLEISEVSGSQRVNPKRGWEFVNVSGRLDSPMMQQVIHLLGEKMGRRFAVGNTPYSIQKEEQRTSILLNRFFTKAEMNRVDYFWMFAKGNIGEIDAELWYHGEFAHQIAASSPVPFVRSKIGSRSIGNAYGYPQEQQLFCQRATRDLLETAGFKGLFFQDCLLTGKSKKDVEISQLRSSIELPYLNNSFHSAGGEVLPASAYTLNEGCFISDFAEPTQLCFPQGVLDQVEPFDIGRTSETMGHNQDYLPPGKTRDSYLVASKALRDFCVEHKLPCHFIPIKEGIPDPLPEILASFI